MPRFVFLDTKPRPDGWMMVYYGHPFPAGEAVEITDPAVVAKARGNRFFREVDEAPADPLDTDGDGTVEVEELRAALTARGIKFDKRWRAKRLREALEG